MTAPATNAWCAAVRLTPRQREALARLHGAIATETRGWVHGGRSLSATTLRPLIEQGLVRSQRLPRGRGIAYRLTTAGCVLVSHLGLDVRDADGICKECGGLHGCEACDP